MLIPSSNWSRPGLHAFLFPYVGTCVCVCVCMYTFSSVKSGWLLQWWCLCRRTVLNVVEIIFTYLFPAAFTVFIHSHGCHFFCNSLTWLCYLCAKLDAYLPYVVPVLLQTSYWYKRMIHRHQPWLLQWGSCWLFYSITVEIKCDGWPDSKRFFSIRCVKRQYKCNILWAWS